MQILEDEHQPKMKTKIYQNKVNITERQDKNERHSLDTIQLTYDKSITESRIKQYYKAIRKEATNTKLIKIQSIIEALDYSDKDIYLKRFERTKECLNIAIQDNDKLIQSRCNQDRLCQNCARAKSSQRIEDFKTDLTRLAEDKGLYFVTLTAPTCRERELRATITKRLKAFAKVKNNISRRYNTKLNGLRKLEVTYNRDTHKYHPHFHFVIQGESEAYLLRDLWLNQFRDASIKAQDIREIKVTKDDASNLIEVFKYATKGVVKDTEDAHAEYHILRAIDRRRIFQTFGELKKTRTTEMSETDTKKIDWTAPNREIFAFENKCRDWTSASGDRLVNLNTIQVQRYERKERKEISDKGNRERTRTDSETITRGEGVNKRLCRQESNVCKKQKVNR